ncbi:MAG: Ig-like domain-containing protein [Planctomycetota bacterium]
MTFSRRPDPLPTPPWALLLGVPLIFALGGCDNPACVFGVNGCQGVGGGGGGGLGSQAASVPVDGNWILPAEPQVLSVFPSGTGAHPSTPIAITFSESLASETLAGAFEVFEEAFGTPVPIIEPPSLTADGRMVILSPLVPLQLQSTYLVRFAEDALVSDLTGQLVDQGASGDIGTFALGFSAPDIPTVIGTFPENLTGGQSDIGEVVVVFDRPMDPASFNTNSWAVTVDGVTPTENPFPLPLVVTGGPVPIPIHSVWIWSSVDNTGRRVSLGAAGAVDLDLSQAPDKLTDEGGNELPATILEYDIATISVPVASMKAVLSDPPDAIGRPNLNDVVPVMQVELSADALPGDVLELFLFGLRAPAGTPLRALARSVAITAPTMLVDVLPGQLALLVGGATSDGVFLDGDLHVAARLTREGVSPALRMTDVDPLLTGAQPLRFDVTAPQVLELGTAGGGTAQFASDLRDLVLVGRANEEIRRVEVSTDGGLDNGVDPPVSMADAAGLFVAAPVLVGLVDESQAPIQYTLRVFDRALNPQEGSTLGTFRQLGAVGRGKPLPGGPVRVDVFDQSSLALLPGALVMSHQFLGASSTPIDSALTDASGRAQVAAAPAGQTVITVDLAGFDLFTFHDLPRDVLQVPLARTAAADATTEGVVTSPFPDANFTTQTNRIGDNRRPADLTRLYDVQTCSVVAEQLLFSCPFGPASILPGLIGGRSFLSGDFNVTQGTFSATGFLRAFETQLPAPPLFPGGAELAVNLFVPELLANADPERQAIAIPPQVLSLAIAPNLGTLSGSPVITIEGISAGLQGSLPVGLGVAFDTGISGQWDVLGAYGGQADGIDDGGGDVLGELVTRGTIQADLVLRAELTDDMGNRVGSRTRFSNLSGLQLPSDVPRFLSPGAGGTSGGASYDVVVADVFRDAAGVGAMIRAEVRDSTGRAWILWARDTTNLAGNIVLHVPDVTVFGGTPLQSGPATCRASVWAWAGLDTDAFLWTDLGRLHEHFGHTFAVPFTLN